ncbi:MAG: DUF1553 domain-containing protein, partial [Planctomycetales bacterium]
MVDKLLEDSRFDRNFMRLFDVMLMERRPEKFVSPGRFREFLRVSFQQRKGLDQIVREIIVADGVDRQQRPAARFLLERDAEPHVVTRDIGRLFLGADLQCAQCHDHPSIDDYLQSDYYGIYAYLNRSYLYDKEEMGKRVVAEKAEGEASFFSVIEGGDPEETSPHLPGEEQQDDPQLAEDKRSIVMPAKGVRPVPAYSRRARLAEELTSGKYPSFQRNLANRLWAHMLGRGIVHPLDLHHSDNPPVHPELLEVLATWLVKAEFDLRKFVREIALSQTYQRSSDLPAGLLSHAQQTAVESEAGALRERKEKLADLSISIRRQQEVFDAEHGEVILRLGKLATSRQQLTASEKVDREKLADIDGEIAAVERMRDELARLKEEASGESQRQQTEMVAIEGQLEDYRLLGICKTTWANEAASDSAKEEVLQQLMQRWRDRFFCGRVSPLTAEQLNWSIAEALGVVERYRQEAAANEAKKEAEKPAGDKQTDPIKRQNRIAAAVYGKVGNSLFKFIVNVHDRQGQPLGQYQATATEPLFLSNSSQIQDWVNGGQFSLVERLEKIDDDATLAEELYVALLSRR